VTVSARCPQIFLEKLAKSFLCSFVPKEFLGKRKGKRKRKRKK